MPDYPIENMEEDKLRRFPLAKKVAELIASFEGKESFVIGIEGVWGSGKTSFINLTLNQIKNEPKLILVNFNPWNFTGQNELIEDFFSTLISKIKPFITDKDKLRKLSSIVSKLTKKSEVSISPEVSAFWGAVNFKANDLFKLKGDEKTLEEERRDIDNLFKQLNKKVVIVIDDIDRLDKEETRLIMKLVKMTANFPNTVFVLCYDREKVAEKLNSEGSGEEYLKKIIQVSFTLPMPDEQGLQKILFGDLDETIKGVYGQVKLEGNDEKRWGDLQYQGFQRPFRTVRDVKRYISSLRLNWSIVEKEDVNQIDFMAIELIRVFAPTLYSGIAGNPNLFTGLTHYISISGNDSKKNFQAKMKELVEVLPHELQNPMKGICEVLFPHLEHAIYGGEWQQEWQREKRICVSERFGFYFQLGIPVGAISEVEANELAETFNDEQAFSEKILELASDKRLRPMLAKILDRVNTFDEIKVKNVISVLWNLENDITEDRSAMFDFDDPETQVSRITYHSLKHLQKDKRFEVLENLVRNSKRIYPPTHFVSILIDQQSKPTSAGDPPLITLEESEKLKEYSLQAINKLASGHKLHHEKEMIFALYRWKEWEGEEKVLEYIRMLFSTLEGLLAFLKGFIRKVLSTAGNYYYMDKQAMESLYPIDDIELLVAKITNEELNAMDEKDKEAILFFRNPSERDK